jgi:hypothetical protein
MCAGICDANPCCVLSQELTGSIVGRLRDFRHAIFFSSFFIFTIVLLYIFVFIAYRLHWMDNLHSRDEAATSDAAMGVCVQLKIR